MSLKTEFPIKTEGGIDRFSSYKMRELDGLVKKIFASVANLFIALGNFFYQLIYLNPKQEPINKEIVQIDPKQSLKTAMDQLIKKGDDLFLTSIQHNMALENLNPEKPANLQLENPFNQDELKVLKEQFFREVLDAYKKDFQETHQKEIAKQDIEDFRCNYIEVIDQIAETKLQNASSSEVKEYKEIIKILNK